MPNPPSSLPLRLPPDFHYECVQCGRSCSAFGEVPVDARSEARLNTLDLETLLPSEDRRPPVVESPIAPERRILKQVRGHCCFLSLQKKCLIHQRYNKEAKPQACQDFPFRYVATPGGDFVGLSFACTAVLEERGPLVEGQAAPLEANRLHTISRRSISLPVRLSDRILLTWKQYEMIESDLLELLETETQPVESRLIAQSLYLRLLEDFVREANAEGLVAAPDPAPEEDPPAPLPHPSESSAPECVAEAAASEEEPAETPPAAPAGSPESARGASLEGVLPNLIITEELIRTFRAQMNKDGWNRLYTLAFKRLEQPILMRSFLGQIIAFRQTLGKEKQGRLASVAMIVGSNLRQTLRMGSLFLTPLPRPVEWKEIRKVKIDFSDPYFAYTVKRFFSHSIFRKDLLLESNLRMAHGFMIMYFGIWRYYTAALTAIEGETKAERRHMIEGLFNVEKFYVFHSSFNTLFSRYPWWRASVETVMNNPAYPASLTRGAL